VEEEEAALDDQILDLIVIEDELELGNTNGVD